MIRICRLWSETVLVKVGGHSIPIKLPVSCSLIIDTEFSNWATARCYLELLDVVIGCSSVPLIYNYFHQMKVYSVGLVSVLVFSLSYLKEKHLNTMLGFTLNNLLQVCLFIFIYWYRSSSSLSPASWKEEQLVNCFFFFSFLIIGQKSFINSSLYLDSSFNLISDCIGYGTSEVAKLFKLLKQTHL